MISSRALKNAKYERYCRLRASALPRIQVYREVGWRSREDDVAYINACRLERRSEIRDRIAYLSQQEEDLVAEKRRRIEEQLWRSMRLILATVSRLMRPPRSGRMGTARC
jgi:hypothetical protein